MTPDEDADEPGARASREDARETELWEAEEPPPDQRKTAPEILRVLDIARLSDGRACRIRASTRRHVAKYGTWSPPVRRPDGTRAPSGEPSRG